MVVIVIVMDQLRTAILYLIFFLANLINYILRFWGQFHKILQKPNGSIHTMTNKSIYVILMKTSILILGNPKHWSFQFLMYLDLDFCIFFFLFINLCFIEFYVHYILFACNIIIPQNCLSY